MLFIRKRLLLACSMIMLSMMAVAQESGNKGTVSDVVDQMPEFNGGVVQVRDRTTGEMKTIELEGGTEGLLKYFKYSLNYPKDAEERCVEGRVVCAFVVERDGSISDVKVVEPVDSSLDKEAYRIIRTMPKWKPGRKNGESIRVRYTVPVTFQLRNGGKEMSEKTDSTETSKHVMTGRENGQIPAQFPGGEKALKKFINKNLEYPDVAAAYDVEGSIIMTFIVNEDGTISDINAHDCKINEFNTTRFSQETEARQKELKYLFAKAFAKEGFRVIRKMPKWIPGNINGKAIRTKVSHSINFYVVGK